MNFIFKGHEVIKQNRYQCGSRSQINALKAEKVPQHECFVTGGGNKALHVTGGDSFSPRKSIRGANPIRKTSVGLVFQTHLSMMSLNGPNLVRNEIHLYLEDEFCS